VVFYAYVLSICDPLGTFQGSYVYKDEKTTSLSSRNSCKRDVEELTIQCGVFAIMEQCRKRSGNPGKMDSYIPLTRHHCGGVGV